MRAGVYYNNRDVRVEERPRPAAGDGEILVKVDSSGIHFTGPDERTT